MQQKLRKEISAAKISLQPNISKAVSGLSDRPYDAAAPFTTGLPMWGGDKGAESGLQELKTERYAALVRHCL
jgi:hypothetical protein